MVTAEKEDPVKRKHPARMLLVAACLLSAVVLGACGGTQSTPQTEAQSGAATSSAPASQSVAIDKPVSESATSYEYEVVNQAFINLQSLFISDSADTVWGADLLAGGLAHEDSIRFETGAEYVDVLFVGTEGDSHEVQNVYLQPGCTIAISAGQTAYGVFVTYADGSGEHFSELDGQAHSEPFGAVTEEDTSWATERGFADSGAWAMYGLEPPTEVLGPTVFTGAWRSDGPNAYGSTVYLIFYEDGVWARSMGEGDIPTFGTYLVEGDSAILYYMVDDNDERATYTSLYGHAYLEEDMLYEMSDGTEESVHLAYLPL